ncbi:MAG: hypothetical protein QXI64_09820 [Sulfolobales archaeon]
MCKSIVYDSFSGTLVCEDSGEVIEERLPENYLAPDLEPSNTDLQRGRSGELAGLVLRIARRLRLPREVVATASSIADGLERGGFVRRSRIYSYAVASIKVASRIHGIHVPIEGIASAAGVPRDRLRSLMACLSATWYVAEKIYPGARRRWLEREAGEETTEERPIAVPA